MVLVGICPRDCGPGGDLSWDCGPGGDLFWGSGPSGICPRDCGPGGQWMGFIFIQWGVVLEPAHSSILNFD